MNTVASAYEGRLGALREDVWRPHGGRSKERIVRLWLLDQNRGVVSLHFFSKIDISGTWRMFGILDAPGASEGKLFKTKEKTTRRAGSIELTMESVAQGVIK